MCWRRAIVAAAADADVDGAVDVAAGAVVVDVDRHQLDLLLM